MKKSLIVFLALAFIFSTVGCGGNGQVEQDPLDKVTVLLDWTPNTNHTGVYAAQALGYYAEEGLEIEIIQSGAGSPAQLVASGQGDIAFSYQEEVTVARTTGLPIKGIAAVIQHNTSGFAAPVSKNIKSPRDFEGKKYGGWGSPAEEAMIKALMNQTKADFSKVEMVNIGSADFFTSVQRDVDFAMIFWGWAGIESELRNIPLDYLSIRDYSDALDFYSPVLVASETTISERSEMLTHFMRATSRGYDYCINNPQEAGEILLSAVPELNRDLVLHSQAYLAEEYQSDAERWGLMSGERWQRYADWMYSQGLIEKQLEFGQAFTNEFLPEAI
ncbi:MAG: ABC transporter substrate-binding protein [Syntrophomonadaceae bacterium]|nr:ABC transporter substrate-binding protein [Syntrophomonadaceae bacterium]